MHRLTDLREILRYVPRFRDRVFVIAMDGAIVEDDNFPNLLLDIALLRSLSIRVALVHGAAHQVGRYAEIAGVDPVRPGRHRHHRRADAAGGHHRRQPGDARNPRRAARHRPPRRPARTPWSPTRPASSAGSTTSSPAGSSGSTRSLLHDAPGARHHPGHPAGRDATGSAGRYRLNSDAVAVEVAKTLRAVKLDLPVHRGRRPRRRTGWSGR